MTQNNFPETPEHVTETKFVFLKYRKLDDGIVWYGSNDNVKWVVIEPPRKTDEQKGEYRLDV